MVKVSTLGSLRVKFFIMQFVQHLYWSLWKKTMVLSHSTKCISLGLLRCTFWAQMLYPLSAKLLLRPGDFLLCVIYRLPTSCNLEGNFHFFLEFWMREVSLSSLSLKKKRDSGVWGPRWGLGGGHKTWNAQEGSHRSEAILTHCLPSLPSSFVSCSFSVW